MKHLYLFFVLGFMFSCSQSSEQSQEKENAATISDSMPESKVENDTVKQAEVVDESLPSKFTWSDTKIEPFYIIALNAFEKEIEAQQWVKERRALGNKSGYLWIPDFKSLSGTKKFAVFYGPYSHDSCYNKVEALRKGDEKGAYGLGIDRDGNRLEFRGWDNTTFNSKKVMALGESSDKIVYVFDPFPDEEASEDWGYYASVVSDYCRENNILVVAAYENFDSVKVEVDAGEYQYFDVSDFKKEGSRGYVLQYGYRRTFVAHDMADGVKAQVNVFFNLKSRDD